MAISESLARLAQKNVVLLVGIEFVVCDCLHLVIKVLSIGHHRGLDGVTNLSTPLRDWLRHILDALRQAAEVQFRESWSI